MSKGTLPPSLSFALICGMMPLLLGLAIFLVWCITHASILEFLGALNIVFGMLMVGIGGISLLAFFVYDPPEGSTRKEMWRWCLLAALVLILNFPVCLAILLGVNDIQQGKRAQALLQRDSVIVVNTSDKPLSKLRVGKRDLEWPQVGPGRSETIWLEPNRVGENKFQAQWNDKICEASLDFGRRSRWADGQTVIIIVKPDGSLQVNTLNSRSASDD